MSDVVITVPKNFTHESAPGKVGLDAWLAEGDRAGELWSGKEWKFPCGWGKPDIEPGERVYIVCNGQLVGYAPLIRLEERERDGRWTWLLVRGGGAVNCTIDERIIGFRGCRERWWDREQERPW